MRRAVVVRSVVLLLAAAAAAIPAAAQPTRPLAPNEPLPKGQRLNVKDGDTVVIPGDARVRIVHRSEASVRAIYNSTQRWLVLLVDYADPGKGQPDGIVDSTCPFYDLDGVWPLGERWQGNAVLDDYVMLTRPDGSIGITTDGAFVQLFSGSPAWDNRWFMDERAIAIGYRGGGRANAFPGGPRQTFDQIEERAIADAIRNAATHGNGASTSPFEGPGGVTFTSRTGMSMSTGASGTPSQPPPPPQAPVRVGGNIRQPIKIADVNPVVPPDAVQAGIRGVVIVEITIGVDGRVSDAKILRSIPLLDQPALDAVRQWRYEPTQLNGRPVPVIMTVTVPFQ